MTKLLLSAFLVVSTALSGGCAKTTLVPIAPDNSDAYKKAPVIFAVLTTGETYEMKDFSIRGDSLAGTRVFRDENGEKRYEQKTAVAIENVNTIQVEKATGRSFMFLGMGAALGLGLSVAAFVAFCFWASD